ncbi:MAG: aspartate--tRNA ligase [Erysipelotrichales bacterium]|nr:aspartate--tRNA ligase [Erysipelotrichales bacterium]
MERTHFNGRLSESNVNEEVTLVGWVHKWRNLGSIMFIDLRDATGIVQVMVNTEEIEIPDVRNEYVIQVKGTVSLKEVENKKLKTGKIEVVAKSIKVINTASQTPLIIDDNTDALEDTRLKYRYLDLRRPCMQEMLRIRAKIVKAVHEYLDANDFFEVETPLLCLSTPEGARDYLVPSRIHKGHFYALPQSPQIYKQLLMIGGLERYYQIARCFRDEDLRADRQPDFTQIDIETSFLDQDQFLTLMEGMIAKIMKDVKGIDIELPLRRMEYDEAVNVYGSDKPDTRFGMHLIDLKDIFLNSEFEAFKTAKSVKCIVVDNIADKTSRKVIDTLNMEARKFNLKGVTVLKLENNELTGSFTKYLKEEESNALKERLNFKNNDIVIIAASDSNRDVCFGLGALRSNYAKELGLIKPDTYDLLWVVHWPLFEYSEKEGRYVSNHHPFTRPCDEDLKYLDSDLSKVYAQAYDIVFNGYEAGGGSLRIYDGKIQKKIFEILGLSEEDIQNKFGTFIQAFNYGTPPHGGMAFGLDRLAMILAGTTNIRDVIAFPKNLSAVCPMLNAPQPVDEMQLKDLHIKISDED